MHIEITEPTTPLPVARSYVLSMTIRSFKGRRDVEVHLYRAAWDETEMNAYEWDKLLGEAIEGREGADADGSKKVLLEAFTKEERDEIIEYISSRYDSRVTAITATPLAFPIPQGLIALSSFPEGKSIGTIKLDKIPNYSLALPVRGLYDLSRHKPLVGEKTEEE